MSRSIFVNLPVADLPAARRFFAALGFGFNDAFSNEHAACMVVADTISVMLLTHAFFAGFTRKPVADAHAATEVLVCLSCDSVAQVDGLADAALALGATEAAPRQDHGFMVGRSFHDLDGHVWELVWMDPAAKPG